MAYSTMPAPGIAGVGEVRGLPSFELISMQSSAAQGEDAPSMIEGTADIPHSIAAAHLPEAAAVFDAVPALDTAMDMVDPQPPLVELLVRHVLLPCERLPHIERNSTAIVLACETSSLRRPGSSAAHTTAPGPRTASGPTPWRWHAKRLESSMRSTGASLEAFKVGA